jgi:hypothetical protein
MSLLMFILYRVIVRFGEFRQTNLASYFGGVEFPYPTTTMDS